MRGSFTVTEHHQGPMLAHGGVVASAMDEGMTGALPDGAVAAEARAV